MKPKNFGPTLLYLVPYRMMRVQHINRLLHAKKISKKEGTNVTKLAPINQFRYPLLETT